MFRRIDRQHSDVDAVATKLYVDSGDQAVVVGQQKKWAVVQEFANLRLVGAVAGLEEEFDGEGAVDQAGDGGHVVSCRVAQGVCRWSRHESF